MDVETFITRWTAREGGAERANYQMFLSDLCDVLRVARPEPAGAAHERNDYVFERAVGARRGDTPSPPRRIDLYKKGAFILEAKQSRLPGKKNAIPGQPASPRDEPEKLGRRSVARGWDIMMKNAKAQAEGYVFLLDADHPAPPFLLTCDVGHCLEVFADFTGTGRAYTMFPDRHGFRVYLEDLRDPKIRERLSTVWTDPRALDPTKTSARVTREIARRLAEVSKRLEQRACAPEDVAHFLMRCLFTMFAEDVDLLPRDIFKTLLERSVEDPVLFPRRLEALWRDMNEGKDFNFLLDARVRKFNGGLFRGIAVPPLEREEIAELLAAARYSWTEVDPAIFGTLLEQALDKTERRKLGAHYTPRAYVQRLVDVTVMAPLRADWLVARKKAEQAKADGDEKGAVAVVRAFLCQLCATRVLDPACGTGNFLYVSLELMKRLEGEVLEVLAELGEPERLGLERETVDPHQFLGLEVNPRAAAIAELVVWIGYLQQHYRTRGGHPGEPILQAFKTINFGERHGHDAVLTWDGYPAKAAVAPGGKPSAAYPTPRRPPWPEAEFIVGNPPFLGKGAAMRGPLGDGYVDALRNAYPHMIESADFVLYWWDHAADLLVSNKSSLKRFGFVTTNSISQTFNRRVLQRHLNNKPAVSLIFVVPDHPWTKATKGAAAVRIAMTVCERGHAVGELNCVVSEGKLDTDSPTVEFQTHVGYINSNLTIGPDVSVLTVLQANRGIASMGPALGSRGFIIDQSQLDVLKPSLNAFEISRLMTMKHGEDLIRESRGGTIIDLNQIQSENELKQLVPHLYQILREKVYPARKDDRDPRLVKYWWKFRRTNAMYFAFKQTLGRYIVTVETAKFRLFFFVESWVLIEHGNIGFGSDDPAMLAVLSSRVHTAWALATGGTLEDRPRYNKIRCFDPFPFPDPPAALKARLREAGEDLDALRKRVLSEHPDLTLTGLYNVLEKLKAGAPLAAKDEDVKRRGLVLILRELHETIDRLSAEAYGWPADLADAQIVERLVALNAERAREEAAGHVRWLRPDYQIPRFAKGAAAQTDNLDLDEAAAPLATGAPAFPPDRLEQPLAVEALLRASPAPMSALEIARAFKRGGKRIEARVDHVLTTLALYGHITVLDNGRYGARQAA